MAFSTGGISLELADLAQVSTVSHKGTMGVFPRGKKGKQRFVIGDDSGTVQSFEMKRGEAQSIFAFRFSEGSGIEGGTGGGGGGGCGTGTDVMVKAVVMGGVEAGTGGGDRVFVTQGASVVGLSKKGKEFFKMSSPSSETIHHVAVQDERIWTGCDYICSAYDNGQDAAFFMCPDKVASLASCRLTGGDAVDAVVGCQDHRVRVIKAEGEGSAVAFEATTDGSVGALCSFSRSGEGADQDKGGIIYGTDKGTIGHLGPAGSGSSFLRKTWELPRTSDVPGSSGFNGGGGMGRGVTALRRCDLTEDGVSELVAGRGDGTVTVYRFASVSSLGGGGGYQGTLGTCPQEAFSTNLGESVRSLGAGRISSADHPEVVACTFRGRVCSLTTESLGKGEAGDSFGRTVGAINSENRAKQLRKEVADLEKRVAIERKQLVGLAKLDGQDKSPASTPATQHFQALTSCTLDPREGAYVISVETPVPLDLVLLHSHVHMDLLESNDGDDLEQAISCVTTLSPENGGGTCATYKFEGEASRLRVRARTTEGDYGDVRLTVVAKIPPNKSAQVIHFAMKPLSLHHRVHRMDADMHSKRPMNSLILRGAFTLQVIHDWLGMCLPDVPPRVSEGMEEAVLHFENVFTGGVLIASYRRGAAVLRSDSASTLAIVKELVSKEATARRLQITDTFQGDPDSVPAFLKLLHPTLTAQFVLARQVELIDALKEVSMQEPECPWMFEEYRRILDNAERIKKEFTGRPRALEYLSGIITDLYVDWHKFRGDDARHHIPELELMLTQYDYNNLVAFFLKRP